MTNEERVLMLKIKNMLGYEPLGMSDLLHILVHPDIRPLLNQYLQERDREA